MPRSEGDSCLGCIILLGIQILLVLGPIVMIFQNAGWAQDMPACKSWAIVYCIADILYGMFFLMLIVIGCCYTNKIMDRILTFLSLTYALYNLISTIIGQVKFSGTSCSELISGTGFKEYMIYNRIFGYIIPTIVIIALIKSFIDCRKELAEDSDSSGYVMTRYAYFSVRRKVTFTKVVVTTTNAPAYTADANYNNYNNNNALL